MGWRLESPELTIVYSTVYSSSDERKHQSSASLPLVRGIRRWPRKMFPFDDVIMHSSHVGANWHGYSYIYASEISVDKQLCGDSWKMFALYWIEWQHQRKNPISIAQLVSFSILRLKSETANHRRRCKDCCFELFRPPFKCIRWKVCAFFIAKYSTILNASPLGFLRKLEATCFFHDVWAFHFRNLKPKTESTIQRIC